MPERWDYRLYRRIMHKYYLFDLAFDLKQAAKREAVEYAREHTRGALMMADRYAIYGLAMREARLLLAKGLVLEFGVSKGKYIRHIAKLVGAEKPVHGFDSFEGLPEDWSGTDMLAGRFSRGGRTPSVPANVTLHKGWIEDTLAPFLETAPGPVAFVNIDVDLYNSARTILEGLGDRLVAGSVVVFDEYFNYPGWGDHEFRAWSEFVAARALTYRYVGFSGTRGQVAVQIVPG